MVDSGKSYTTKMYSLDLTPSFAVVTYLNAKTLAKETLDEVRKILSEYYSGRDFVLINHRIHKMQVEPTFYKSALTNMKAVAIVAEDDDVREHLYLEQKNYEKSFAFFKSLEDAKDWAVHFF